MLSEICNCKRSIFHVSLVRLKGLHMKLGPSIDSLVGYLRGSILLYEELVLRPAVHDLYVQILSRVTYCYRMLLCNNPKPRGFSQSLRISYDHTRTIKTVFINNKPLLSNHAHSCLYFLFFLKENRNYREYTIASHIYLFIEF
jgi:hypothetical protein